MSGPPLLSFEALRAREFPWSDDRIYLDHASIGPLPERTRRALDAFNARRADPATLTADDFFPVLARARTAAARLIGATPDEIALTTATSFGINVAAASLPLESGSTILVSDTEFPANVYPWLQQRRRGLAVELVPTTPEGWPDESRMLERIARGDVGAVAVSHVQFATGYRADLDALSDACREHGAFLAVDAIQALGHVPLDVQRTPVDVVACGGQKWLLSPWGSGFVYVRRDLIPQLAPPVVGWMAFEGTDDLNSLTSYDDRLRADGRRFELNTLPFQDFAGFATSVELLLELGIDRIHDRLAELVTPLWEAGRQGVFTLASPMDAAHRSAIVSLRVERPAALWRRLRDEGITCALREGLLRFSPHAYNTPDEIARVLEVVCTP